MKNIYVVDSGATIQNGSESKSFGKRLAAVSAGLFFIKQKNTTQYIIILCETAKQFVGRYVLQTKSTISPTYPPFNSYHLFKSPLPRKMFP